MTRATWSFLFYRPLSELPLEILDVVSQASPGVAIAALALFFHNQMVVKALEDRREWNEYLRRTIDRYDTRLVAATDTMVRMAGEMATLREKLQAFVLSVDNQLDAIENRLRDKSGD